MDIKRIRGLKALVHDAVDLSTFLVREGHESVSRAVLRITNHIEPLAGPASTVDAARRLSTDVVLGTIRLVNRGVETVTDLGFDVAQRAMEAQREAGDHPMLQRAVPMRSDVDPRGIERSLEHAFILERIAPQMARFRLAGMHLTDLMGMEVRGMPTTALFAPAARAALPTSSSR